ncbi:MAG: T9SS type A sorting domain-containing protein [Bacteroidota bacterium]
MRILICEKLCIGIYRLHSNVEIIERTINDFIMWGKSGDFSLTVENENGERIAPYEGKLILLFDERIQSQAEYTCMGLEQYPNVVKIGSTTSGADGNITTAASFLGVFYPDYRPTQRIGILPDIEVRPTIEGIRNGVDEVMEYAVKEVLQCDQPEIDIPAVRIFPNPTSGILNYQVPGTLPNETISIEIFNGLGQKVSTYESTSPADNLDVSDLAAGSYFIRINTVKEVFVETIVKAE